MNSFDDESVGTSSVVKVGMVSLGCPKNQMDAEIMLGKIDKVDGFELVAESGLADVVIVNTCGFIGDAKQESIDYILEYVALKIEGQIKRIIVTGCLAQRYKLELARELNECDAVLGLGANDDIVTVIRDVMGLPAMNIVDIEDGAQGDQIGQITKFPTREKWSLEGERVQTTPHFFAYLRVSDGCDNRCTYCAIPSIRGPLRSRKMENIIDEAKELAHNGVREIVLVAQDTTLYGLDIYGEGKIVELLNELCKIDEIRWVRMLYCYPEHLSSELIDTIANQPKIAKYLDLPIQHCDDEIIKAMHRKGSEKELRTLISEIRDKIPDIVLRTTVIVGFPGETDEQFQKLCDFTSDIKFERLGCFKYSREEGTKAASFENQIDDEVKNRRYDIIMEQQSLISDRYNSSLVGKTLDVLVEDYDKYAECFFGRSEGDAPDIDFKVFFPRPKFSVRPGDFIKVKIDDVLDLDLMGECLD